jgi:hypothetical protein
MADDGKVWPELVRRLREAHISTHTPEDAGALDNGLAGRSAGGPLGDPADVHIDAPALVRQLREMQASTRLQPVPSGYRALEAKLDALMALLGLGEKAVAFVNHLAEYPTDRPTLLVFRDWLRDQQRDLEADAFEELAGEGKGA